MELFELNWTEVAGLSKDMPVVIPIAAMEQHGRHMPLFTDSMLLGEVVSRSIDKLEGRALFTPLMWLGNSDHHIDFPGTMSAPPRVYLDMLNGLAENFISYGFRRILFINGHGGNIIPGQQAIFELRQKHRSRNDLLLLLASYWGLGKPPHERDSRFLQGRMGHACEYETSMMLRLAPHLVGEIHNLEAVDFGFAFEPAYRGWITKDRTVPGHIGDPKHASAEKGELLFEYFSADLVTFVERVIAWNGSEWN